MRGQAFRVMAVKWEDAAPCFGAVVSIRRFRVLAELERCSGLGKCCGNMRKLPEFGAASAGEVVAFEHCLEALRAALPPVRARFEREPIGARAAGAVEAVVTAKTIQEGLIHATVGTKNPDPECDLDYCINGNVQQEVKAALSNSLGFGGHNATLCFKKVTD